VCEVLYGAGLRVSELCGLKRDLRRLSPGTAFALWARPKGAHRAAASPGDSKRCTCGLKTRAMTSRAPTRRPRPCSSTDGAADSDRVTCAASWTTGIARGHVHPHAAAPHLRDTSARRRRGPARRARAPRPRESHDDADLHPRFQVPTAEGPSRHPPEGLAKRERVEYFGSPAVGELTICSRVSYGRLRVHHGDRATERKKKTCTCHPARTTGTPEFTSDTRPAVGIPKCAGSSSASARHLSDRPAQDRFLGIETKSYCLRARPQYATGGVILSWAPRADPGSHRGLSQGLAACPS